MARFHDLSEEVVFIISEQFEHERDLSALARTSRPLYHLLNPRLYSQHVRLRESWALTWAAKHGRVDTAKILLAAGADVMARTADILRMPAINVAADSGSLAMVKLLCETEGVDPDWDNEDIPSAITLAAEVGSAEVVRYFLSDARIDPQRDDYDEPPLSVAARSDKDNVEVIRLLLADPRVTPPDSWLGCHSPMTLAARYGHAANLCALIDAGLDVNECDGYNVSPLFCAAVGNNAAAAQVLLATSGIDPNPVDAEGNTPLITAASREDIDFFRVLIGDNRVLPNVVNAYGDTALTAAVTAEAPGIVELLLGRPETDINFHDKSGHSSLQLAIDTGQADVVELLIKDPRFDAEASASYDDPWSPIIAAVQCRNPHLVRLLCEDGRFPVLAVDEDGRNALSVAVSEVSLNTVKYLLELADERGDLDFHVKDNNGATPYMLAVERGMYGIIALLEPFKDRG